LEGFVIESILAVASAYTDAFFYRTSAGAEIDLVLNFGDQRWAIEIKHTAAPKVSKGFYLACEDINLTAKFVVHAGADRFPISNEVEAIALHLLMNKLQVR